MGCHTWFSRPITIEEFKLMEEYALEDAEKIFGDTKENRELCPSSIIPYNIELIKRSLETNEACYYGMTWYEAGFGHNNPELIKKLGDIPYIRIFKNRGQKGINSVYIDASLRVEFENNIFKFHDVFRIHNYPNKVIYNKHELRRFLRKKYFDLTEEQLKKISIFFKLYPGGVIDFG